VKQPGPARRRQGVEQWDPGVPCDGIGKGRVTGPDVRNRLLAFNHESVRPCPYRRPGAAPMAGRHPPLRVRLRSWWSDGQRQRLAGAARPEDRLRQPSETPCRPGIVVAREGKRGMLIRESVTLRGCPLALSCPTDRHLRTQTRPYGLLVRGASRSPDVRRNTLIPAFTAAVTEDHRDGRIPCGAPRPRRSFCQTLAGTSAPSDGKSEGSVLPSAAG
jgi:hypothetical protein